MLAQKAKNALNNYVKNERKCRQNWGKRCTNQSASAPPQECSTSAQLLNSMPMLTTTNSYVPLVTKSGRQATQLAQY